MNFGKIAMKLRYGQVAMKILRYGPIGEIRAESPATGPPAYWDKKTTPFLGWFLLAQNNRVCLADNDCYHARGRVTEKTVIPDKMSNSHILPQSPVQVLIPQSIILRQPDIPIIGKSTICRHGIISYPFIVSRMLGGSSCKVVCRANLENIASLYVYIMSDVQKLLLPCLRANYEIPLFRQGRGRPALPRYFLGFRFWTSVSSKLSPPIENAIWRSLFVIARSTIEN